MRVHGTKKNHEEAWKMFNDFLEDKWPDISFETEKFAKDGYAQHHLA